MKTVILDNNLTEKVRDGYRPSWKEMTENIDLPGTLRGYVKLVADSSLVAVMEVDRASTHEKNWLKKLKVFN